MHKGVRSQPPFKDLCHFLSADSMDDELAKKRLQHRRSKYILSVRVTGGSVKQSHGDLTGTETVHFFDPVSAAYGVLTRISGQTWYLFARSPE